MSRFTARPDCVKVGFFPDFADGRTNEALVLTDGQSNRIMNFRFVEAIECSGLAGYVVIAEFESLAQAAKEAPALEAKIVRLLERTTPKESP